MDTQTLLEIFGWIGSGLVILSLVLADQRRFRLWNLTGSLIATIYNIIIGVWPAVAMNGAIVLIDLYWLIRLEQEARKSPVAGDNNLLDSSTIPAKV